MIESKFQTEVIKFLKEQGCYIVNYVALAGKGGIPDLLVSYKGLFIGLELKTGNYKPTALQIRNIEWIRDSGGYGLIFWHSDLWKKELLEVLNTIYLEGGGFYGKYPIPPYPKDVIV